MWYQNGKIHYFSKMMENYTLKNLYSNNSQETHNNKQEEEMKQKE